MTSAPETPSLEGAVYIDSRLPVETRIEDLLSRMTLEEKIGQMALVDKNSVENMEDVSRFGLGAILSGGGGKPTDNTPEGWRDMIAAFVDESRRSRTGIPILYGVDANHGHGNVPGATIFPHQIGLGATHDAALVEKVARATAEEALAIGSRWNFAPSLDLPTDIRWGRVYEAFSSDSILTGELGAAYVRGAQGTNAAPLILATPKHYLGAGSMQWDTSSNPNFRIDQGVTPQDEHALRTAYLSPFQKAIESGAQSIMLGLNSWGDTKLSASRYLVTDVLKGELGFEGFVVSDWYAVYEISDSKYFSAVTAINAGVDMVMLPFEYQLFVSDVTRAVARGDITEERIDDAVRRILRAKFSLNLFSPTETRPLSVIGSAEHRTLAREAVAQSLVILKNNDVLPVSRNARKIRVAGSAADNIGIQAGAWTVEWQGIDGNWLPGATSILAGLREAAPHTPIEYSIDGIFVDKDIADVGIAIVGEKPYAEGWGDNPEPRISVEDLETIERLKASSRHVVVILISGRPLIVTDELAKWDAFIAAWLPGSEGSGVADVLFGDVTSTATLPLTWPRTAEQLPLTITGRTRDGTTPLFPRGFGLSAN